MPGRFKGETSRSRVNHSSVVMCVDDVREAFLSALHSNLQYLVRPAHRPSRLSGYI